MAVNKSINTNFISPEAVGQMPDTYSISNSVLQYSRTPFTV